MTTSNQADLRSYDLQLTWLTHTYGPEWGDWQRLAANWLSQHQTAMSTRLIALSWFIENYLIALSLPCRPADVLSNAFEPPNFFAQLMGPVNLRGKAKGYSRRDSATRINNLAHEFLEWVLLELFGIENDYGYPVVPGEYRNPVPRLMFGQSNSAPAETVRTALPYRYIDELRQVVCPKQNGNFGDWEWAQSALDDERNVGGDWIPVYYDQIDPSDPDCVWRCRIAPEFEAHLAAIGRRRKVVSLWSPVRAMVLYLKLELPLRTFQVRLLDSGEADTWRYVQGNWQQNDGPLVQGTTKRPWQRGIFRRLIYGSEVQIGMYVNTNKTADIGKDVLDRGYVIPWRHERVLYWLEKLRNWQEKYNPIEKATPWTDLKPKHLDDVKAPQMLERMGATCFLFRHAAAAMPADTALPISSDHVSLLWSRLLRELESRCAARKETTRAGEPLLFVKDGSRRGSWYPLHALRVSLLTSFAIEGGVPIPILSKLVAGHARIIMTLYYTKVGQAHMNTIMGEAERRLVERQQGQFERFLVDADYQQIKAMSVFNDEAGIMAVGQSRNPSGWEMIDKGICPHGCTGCHNGGPLIASTTWGANKAHASVPKDSQGNPRNCVRCRWFITGPAFLPGLVAHFNNLSYEASEVSKRYCQYDAAVTKLENEQWDCTANGQAFLLQGEMVRAQQIQAQEAERADAIMNDMHATMQLIRRCLDLGKSAPNTDDVSAIELIGFDDLRQMHADMREATNELHQLEVVCRHAVVFPGYDATRATLRRSQVIDAMLQLNRREPVLLRLAPDEQLHVGNAVMRLIEVRTGSLESAVRYVSAEQALADVGILDDIEHLAAVAGDMPPAPQSCLSETVDPML